MAGTRWINKTVVQLAAGGTNNTGSTSTVNFTAALAGNLLVAVASGSVTSTTPTGWTLGASAVGSSGSYVWWKVATGNESSFSTTHNGSGYPNAYVIYEFPAGSSFVKGSGTAGLAAGTANPTISSLTGTNLLMASVSESYPYTTYNGTGITWSAGTTVDTDIHAAHVSTDGYWLGIGFAENSSATSYGPNPTLTDPNGVVASERLTWAINVAPKIQFIGSANLTFATTGAGTANLTVPTGVTANHLAVVMVANADSYSGTDTVTPPAGWTVQSSKPVAANNSGVYIYSKLGGYAAGQTIPFTTNSGAQWEAYAVWYDTQGYDIGIVGTVGGRSGTSSANTVIPGITTLDNNQDIIIVATERTLTNGTTVTGTSGFTPIQDFFFEDANTATSGYFARYTKAAAGATGNLTLTYPQASGNGAGMMFGINTPKTNPIALVGVPTTADGNTAVASAAVNVPAGTKIGEILLATITTGSSGASISTPSGWNTIQTGTDTNYNVFWVGYRVVDGTETASYTWNWTSTTYHMATMSRVAGSNGAAAIRTTSESWGSSGTSYVGPSLNSTQVQSVDKEFYFFVFTDNAGQNQASAPTISSGYTADYSRVLNTKSQMLAHANASGLIAAPTATTPAAAVPASVAFAVEPWGAAAVTKASTISEDFGAADTSGHRFWYDSGASVVSGQLNLAVHAAYDSGITSVYRFDFTNSSLSAQFIQPPNIGNGTTETFLMAKLDNNNNKVQWAWGNGQLNAQAIVNGAYTTVGSIAYNASTTKYLRMRHDGAKVQWDYSADGLTWTTVGTGWTPTFPVNNLYLLLYAGYYGTEPSPGTAIWDNVNITPVAGSGGVTFQGRYTSNINNTTSQTAVVQGAQAGDLLVYTAWTGYGGCVPVAPTTTGLTWTLREKPNSTDNIGNAEVAVYTAPVTTAGTYTVTGTVSTSGHYWGFQVQRWSGAKLGTSVWGNATASGTISFTQTTANSALVFADVDYNGQDSAPVYSTATAGAYTPTFADPAWPYGGGGADWTAYVGFYINDGATGSKTIGVTSPTGQLSAIAALELIPNPVSGLILNVYHSGSEVAGTATVYNGTTEIPVVKTEKMPSGISVTNMSSSTYQPFFIAHRGGSADWAEHSMRGNTQSVYLKMDGIEISLARTSDGVWFGLHDQYLNRTSPTAPTNFDPSVHTWAEVSAYQCIAPSGGDATFGAQPYCKLQDALNAYAKSHVIFIDPKYVSSSYYSELLNIMDANGGTDRFIAKFSGGGEAWTPAAKVRGYKSWGYFYMTDVDAGQP
jgi:hypothetical protein